MTENKAVMQQALDALGLYLMAGHGNSTDFAKQSVAYDEAIESIATLGAAIAQQEQPGPLAAPDGWRLVPLNPTPAMKAAGSGVIGQDLAHHCYASMIAVSPAIAQPEQPAPVRQPMTDIALFDIADDFKSQYMHAGTTFDGFDCIGFARAIEAAHGIAQPKDKP